MTAPGGPVATSRALLLLPLLHTGADHGGLAGAVRARKLARLGAAAARRGDREIARLWDRIEAFVRSLPASLERYRAYQDSLPVCGFELDIVRSLAGDGSRNHRVLLDLHARGARLEGTESPDLLLEAVAQVKGDAPRRGVARGGSGPGDLLERRDRFIAGRIAATLEPGETGLLFLGALHDVARFLPPDVQLVRPLHTKRP